MSDPGKEQAFPGKASPSRDKINALRKAGVPLLDAKQIVSYGGGMDIRTWLAGQALSGCATRIIDPLGAAREAREIADRLLIELEQEKS